MSHLTIVLKVVFPIVKRSLLCEEVLIPILQRQPSFLEIDAALLILANSAKYLTTCQMDVTRHE